MIILAGAIVLTLTQSGVFDKANEATGKYNLQQVQKIAELAWAEAYADGERDVTKLQDAVDKALADNKLTAKYKAIADEKGVTVKEKGPGGIDPVGDATVNQIAEENSTIDGKPYSATNPIIPKGFMPINTATSKWDEGIIADNVKNGLVISDGNENEFVWIPVDDINEMVRVKSGTDANGRTNYIGKTYEFWYYDEEGNPIAKEEEYGTNYCPEPINITKNEYDEGWGMVIDEQDRAERFTIEKISQSWNENYYQEEFNKMVESVAKYKGFYMGRYEMSLDENGNAQSKAGATSSNASDTATNKWWGLYEKATTYSKSTVTSEMIWGCQYEAMLRWLQENKTDVISLDPIDAARGKVATGNETRITGANDSNDILNNVYDLIGNSVEWTQQRYGGYKRTGYGGFYSSLAVVADKDAFPEPPTSTSSDHGTRLAIYIPVTD